MRVPARERAAAALIAILAAVACVVVAAAAGDLDRRTAERQQKLDCLLAPACRTGAAGAVRGLDGLFPGLQVVRDLDDCGCSLRLLPERGGERT